MIDKLQAELVKAQDSLSEISFILGEEKFSFHYRYLTLLEKVRIEQMSISITQVVSTDGSTIQKHEKKDHLIPIYTIIEKALDAEGKRIFSHTDPEHFKMISDFPAGLSSRVAYEMSMDIFGTMKSETE